MDQLNAYVAALGIALIALSAFLVHVSLGFAVTGAALIALTWRPTK